MMTRETIERARSYFPFIKNGIIYFNHASTAPVSLPVRNKLENLLKEKSEEKIDDYQEFKKLTDETKSIIGKMINCMGERIAFLQNTTNGLIVLALGFEWKRGDRIILNDVEFPANVYQFLQLRDKGVEIDFVKSKNGIVTAEEIIDTIKPGTKLISISFVQFLSGYKIDLEMIGKVCTEKGIIFCVDAAQGLGASGIDVEKCKIDFLSCGTQKWLLGLQGLSFIYVKKELQERLRNYPVGWLAVDRAWDMLNYDLTLKQTAERFQPGTLNLLGIYAFNSSLKIFEEFGIENIEIQVRENSSYFINGLKEIGIDSPLFSLEDKYKAGIVSFKNNRTEVIFNKLSSKKIICSLREGYLRFAPHFYNTQNEINIVLDELKNI